MTPKIVFKCLTTLSGLVPKKKNLWSFGCWDGHLYGDNSKYMFEFINKNHPEIECVWLTKEEQIAQDLRSKGYRAEYAKSPKGIFTLCRSYIFFETSGFGDLSYFIVKGVREVQLWHGMGFKNVGKNDVQSANKELYEHFVNGDRKDTLDLANWCVASLEAKKKYSDSFSVPEDRFHITGQPKDDLFICPENDGVFRSILGDNKYKKVVFYLPTHRNFGKTDDKSMLQEDILRQVNSKLSEYDVLLLYKPHYNDRKHFDNFSYDFSNIRFLTDFTQCAQSRKEPHPSSCRWALPQSPYNHSKNPYRR